VFEPKPNQGRFAIAGASVRGRLLKKLFRWRRFPFVLLAAVLLTTCLLAALFANVVAPSDPFDLNALDLNNANRAPAWLQGGTRQFLLGTDDQGRDLLSLILYGARISLLVAVASVLLSLLIGVPIGLVAGYFGGWPDALLMRLADAMLAFPSILVALTLAGVVRALYPNGPGALDFGVVVLSMVLTGWVDYARAVRGSTLAVRHQEYVQAAWLMGLPAWRILRRHVLPNVMGPVWVLATVQVGAVILGEATLSYLGVGAPPTAPSLGTVIRIGNDYLLSGQWWITFFPCVILVTISLTTQLLGDWLRDHLHSGPEAN
jgi:peptide/nickel transport system permease protein